MANRLKELRKEKRMFQTEVANILGTSQATLSGWETGRIQISREDLFRLADFYGVSIDYILGYSATSDQPTETQQENELKELCKDATEEQLNQIKQYAQFILSHKAG